MSLTKFAQRGTWVLVDCYCVKSSGFPGSSLSAFGGLFCFPREFSMVQMKVLRVADLIVPANIKTFTSVELHNRLLLKAGRAIKQTQVNATTYSLQCNCYANCWCLTIKDVNFPLSIAIWLHQERVSAVVSVWLWCFWWLLVLAFACFVDSWDMFCLRSEGVRFLKHRMSRWTYLEWVCNMCYEFLRD